MILAVLLNANYLVSWLCVYRGQKLSLLRSQGRWKNQQLTVQASLYRKERCYLSNPKGWDETFNLFADAERSETLVRNPNGISNLLFILLR